MIIERADGEVSVQRCREDGNHHAFRIIVVFGDGRTNRIEVTVSAERLGRMLADDDWTVDCEVDAVITLPD